MCRNAEEALMTIVAGFDVHRRQIRFDALDTETGEVCRGRIDATPAAVRRWSTRAAPSSPESEAAAFSGGFIPDLELSALALDDHLDDDADFDRVGGGDTGR
jgi:hypothetical protein